MEITNIYQATVKTYDYDAFGRILGDSGSLGHNAFTYTGREYHSRSGLYYYRARFYDPHIGRFITQDPIGHLGGTNLYAYVGNTPVDLVDPLGLQEIFANLPPEIANDYAEAFEGTADYYHGMYDRAHELRSDAWQRQSPNMPHKEASYERHFSLTYQLTLEYGPYDTRLAGYANEFQGLGHDLIPPRHIWDSLRGNRPWGFSLEDLLTNELGIWAAQSDMCPKK